MTCRARAATTTGISFVGEGFTDMLDAVSARRCRSICILPCVYHCNQYIYMYRALTDLIDLDLHHYNFNTPQTIAACAPNFETSYPHTSPDVSTLHNDLCSNSHRRPSIVRPKHRMSTAHLYNTYTGILREPANMRN
jgi:hypothetical protein